MFIIKVLAVALTVICLSARAAEIIEWRKPRQGNFEIGSCKLVVNQPCPHPNIKFFLYARSHPDTPEPVKIGDSQDKSNITYTDFDYRLPTKIIIHGYNSDMYLSALVEVKRQYLRCSPYNIFAVDWSPLAPSPCYLSAMYNIRQVGKCTAQLIERIRELGAVDIHVVGFSLGAHVPNFIAKNLLPYKLPRISGLDPAMPGFTFVSSDNKLDSSDAEFVDVIHTNAFMQGQIVPSGHVDFYMNGGVVQPGCWAEDRFFACNHHRAPLYFAESITSSIGFWGWPCRNYFMYLIGQCPPKEPQVIAGEFVNRTARGMHLIITNSVSPFAVGKFTKPAIEIVKTAEQQRMDMLKRMKHIAEFRKMVEECVDADDFMDVFTEKNFYDDQIEVAQVF